MVSSTSPGVSDWEPEDVLDLVDTDTGGITCVCYLPIQGRRCHNPIAWSNIRSGMVVVSRLKQADLTDKRNLESLLRNLAGYLLCRRNHQLRVDEVVKLWRQQIRQITDIAVPNTDEQIELCLLRQEHCKLREQLALCKDHVRLVERAQVIANTEHEVAGREAADKAADFLRTERGILQRQKDLDEQARTQWLAEQRTLRDNRRLQEDLDRDQRMVEEKGAREQRQRQDALDREERLRQDNQAGEQRIREELQSREQRLREEELAREQRLCKEQQAREQRLREEQGASRLRAQRRWEEESQFTSQHRERLARENEAAMSLLDQADYLRRRGEALRAEEEACERDAEAARHREDARRAEHAAQQREAEASEQREEAGRRLSAAERAECRAREARARAVELSRWGGDVAERGKTMRGAELRNRQRYEREESARLQQEQIEWTASWTRYDRDWTNILRLDRVLLNEDVRDSLPWPVKDGQRQQVTERNVEDFFAHGQPRGMPEDRTWMCRVLRRQALRWREDYLLRQFPRAAGDEEVLGLARVVAGVIERLRDTAISSLV